MKNTRSCQSPAVNGSPLQVTFALRNDVTGLTARLLLPAAVRKLLRLTLAL